ncbi:hypothetical protein AAVH_05161 [Aphelenchoides avenae]|nr:hypothetical protein AAVH_05161 [Aphelenchus avenae]
MSTTNNLRTNRPSPEALRARKPLVYNGFRYYFKHMGKSMQWCCSSRRCKCTARFTCDINGENFEDRQPKHNHSTEEIPIANEQPTVADAPPPAANQLIVVSTRSDADTDNVQYESVASEENAALADDSGVPPDTSTDRPSQETLRSRKPLVYKGFRYNCRVEEGKKMYWTCSRRRCTIKCPAKFTCGINGENFDESHPDHNHSLEKRPTTIAASRRSINT